MRHRLLRAAVGAAGAIVVGGTLVAIPANAGSSGIKPVTACGTQITSKGHWALMNDIGPCTGDGVDIMANSVTLSLNGHTITGSDTTNTSNAGGTNADGSPIPGNSEQVGVALMGSHGVKVTGAGTVTAFDAGVAVMGGSGNTITGVTAHDNIAHVLLIPGVNGGSPCAGGTTGCMWNTANPAPLTYPCNDGDGIFTDNSNENVISGNTTYHNGPFDGIALVDSSSDNQVTGNDSYNQTVSNIIPAYASGTSTSTNGPCGPFQAKGAGPGRPHQDIGIRIEGPGATYNVVSNNMSTGNQLEGISIHDNVCPGVFSFLPNGAPPNDYNTVENNVVSHNGYADGTDGIAILQQGPLGVVCIPSNNSILNNTSTLNARDGVYVGGRTASGNIVSGNTVTGNGKDGVELQGGSFNSSGTYVPGAESDTVSGNTANSNSHDGIELDTGAFSNTISGNTANSNTTWDGADDNSGCDSNSWSGDTFGTASQTCVS